MRTATLAWVMASWSSKNRPASDLEAAHIFVLGADAEQHGVLGDAAAHGDAVVVLEHG